jgi:hypothetical protein
MGWGNKCEGFLTQRMEYMFYDNIKQKDPWVRHRRKIPSLGIGKQQEKIQVWRKISPQWEKKCLP